MTTYTVDFARVRAVLANVEQIDSKIRSMLTSLEHDSERNLAEWRSEAQTAYRTCKAKWDASAAQMPALLGQARSAADQMMTNYEGVEKKNVQTYPGFS